VRETPGVAVACVRCVGGKVEEVNPSPRASGRCSRENPSSYGLVLPTRRRDPLVLQINEESLEQVRKRMACTGLRPGVHASDAGATRDGARLQPLGHRCRRLALVAAAKRSGGPLEPRTVALCAASIVTSPLAGASSADDAPAGLLPPLRPPAACIPLHAPPSRTQAADSSRVASATRRRAVDHKIDSMTSVPPAAPSSLGSRLGGGEGLKRSTAFTNALLTSMRFT